MQSWQFRPTFGGWLTRALHLPSVHQPLSCLHSPWDTVALLSCYSDLFQSLIPFSPTLRPDPSPPGYKASFRSLRAGVGKHFLKGPNSNNLTLCGPDGIGNYSTGAKAATSNRTEHSCISNKTLFTKTVRQPMHHSLPTSALENRYTWGQPGGTAVKFTCSTSAAQGLPVQILGADMAPHGKPSCGRRPTYKVEEDGHGC